MWFDRIDSRLCSVSPREASKPKASLANAESRGWMDACSNREQRDENRMLDFL